jgi:superfamily I DNA/RNA helicase
MGLVSLLEDSLKNRGAGDGGIIQAPNRVKHLLDELKRIYERAGGKRGSGRWETHLRTLDELTRVLRKVDSLPSDEASAWTKIRDIEEEARKLFRGVEEYGPPSFQAVIALCKECQDVVRKCKRILDDPQLKVEADSRDDEEARNLLSWAKVELAGITDLVQGTDGVESAWREFEHQRLSLGLARKERPILQELDRYLLDDEQKRFVAHDYSGAYRILGASGTGKTVILLHRALRLAVENSSRMVFVLTVSRELALHLEATIRTLNGRLPQNLVVESVYDLFLGCLRAIGLASKVRLLDPQSRENAESNSWDDFFRQPSNVIEKAPDAIRLVTTIEERLRNADAARRYLHDEVVYVQSAYAKRTREKYLESKRASRSIPLNRPQRETVLRILDAWHEWLSMGHLSDIAGVASLLASRMDSSALLRRIGARWRIDHVLIDEVQDVSTLELQIVSRLLSEREGKNAVFMVGDINQKVYAKHHSSQLAGFNFSGKSAILKNNYRNTRPILEAAHALARRFPPRGDEEAEEIIPPNYSTYDGPKPILWQCRAIKQVDLVAALVDVAQESRKPSIAFVTENEDLLHAVQGKLKKQRVGYFILQTNAEPRAGPRNDIRTGERVAVGRLEAVKGFEFDVVIAGDLSRGVIPRAGAPRAEWWRAAAMLYAALTRARCELHITCGKEQSEFLEPMLNADTIDVREPPDCIDIGRYLWR